MVVVHDTKPACQKPLRSKAKRCGATATEFAIVAPLLLATFLGIIELSRGLMTVHLLTLSAQAGCRAGIVAGKSNSDISTAAYAALANTGISGETASVLVNEGASDASTAATGDEITVKVQVPFSSISWIPGSKYLSGNLKGQYTLRRQ